MVPRGPFQKLATALARWWPGIGAAVVTGAVIGVGWLEPLELRSLAPRRDRSRSVPRQDRPHWDYEPARDRRGGVYSSGRPLPVTASVNPDVLHDGGAVPGALMAS